MTKINKFLEYLINKYFSKCYINPHRIDLVCQTYVFGFSTALIPLSPTPLSRVVTQLFRRLQLGLTDQVYPVRVNNFLALLLLK